MLIRFLPRCLPVLLVLAFVPAFAAILRIPFSIIGPAIIVICAIGAYTVHSSMFDVYLMLGFGVLGYVLRKLKYPLAPLVLALVLGDRAEDAFRQSMLLSQGNLGIFFSTLLVATLTIAALSVLIVPSIAGWRRRRRTGAA